MDFFINQVIHGITIGMIYGLAAIGFTMVYKALQLLNFSHSETITLGALTTYTFIVLLDLPVYLALPLVLVSMMVYGFLVEKGIFTHFRSASGITFMLVSISWASVLRNVLLLVWGPEPRSLPLIFDPTQRIMIGNTIITANNLFISLIAILILGVMQLFFTRTKFGLAMRIAAEDPETAGVMGVNVSGTRAATFALTAILGGAAGFLVAPLYSVTLELGSSLALKVFISAVVGGVGNLWGAIGGGLIVGMLESVSAGYIPSGLRDVIVFAFGITVLAFFPLGIFQKRVDSKF